MKIDSVNNYNPQFAALCSIHGNNDALTIDELRKIIMLCREIGTNKDWYDIHIPNVEKYPNGLLPIAEYADKNLRAIFGEYKNGNVFPTIIKCLDHSKNKLIDLKNSNKKLTNNWKCTLHGNLDALDKTQISTVIKRVRALGSEGDRFDFYIPYSNHRYAGLIPIAAFVRGRAIATFGAYKNGDVFYGVLNGINNIKNNIVKQPRTKSLNKQK